MLTPEISLSNSTMLASQESMTSNGKFSSKVNGVLTKKEKMTSYSRLPMVYSTMVTNILEMEEDLLLLL